MEYTKKEYDCLLKLRKKTRTWNDLKRLVKVDDDTLNIMLSRMERLYYVVDDQPVMQGRIKLNQIGETVAQSEFDRRFDMYFTRGMSLAALVVSALTAIVTAIKG